MHRYLALAISIALSIAAFAQVRPAYTLFNAKGKKISHAALLRTARGGDIILFG